MALAVLCINPCVSAGSYTFTKQYKCTGSYCDSAVLGYYGNATGAGCQQDERRPHALAAAADDVLRNLADEHDLRMQTVANDGVDGLHVRLDQGVKLFRGHIGPVSG